MGMAEDCVTRVCALAIATAACVGLPGALVYAIVRTAAARRFGATAALFVGLVFWVTVSAAYYPRVCTDVVRGSALVRRVRGQRASARHPRGGALLPGSAVAERQGGRGGMTRRNGSSPPAHERRAARAHGETSERCAVCLCDVEMQGETTMWLPACLHVFHRHCIDQWLHLHGHSTCPICRSDAFVAPPLPHQGGPGGMSALPLASPPPAVRGGARVAVVDTLASYERQRNGASLVPPPPPPFAARGRQEDHHCVMTALPREPPAARGILASSSYERRQPGDGERSERCAVCLCDVEMQGETATWLPVCLHVFHRHCIDQWLHLHGHSTCPICRSDAFAAAGAHDVTFSSFRSVLGVGRQEQFLLDGQ